jgi:RNA-directed DNA polymerase
VKFPRATHLVVICRTGQAAQEALQKIKQIMVKLKLTLHPTKTRIVNMNQEGFDFLGFHFHKMKSKNTHKLVPYMWPGQKAMKKVRKKIHEITDRKWLCDTHQEIVHNLNPVIRGWRNYFRCGNSTEKMQQLDIYVWQRLRRWARLRKGSRGYWNRSVFASWIAQSGLEHFYRSGICVDT